jgi:hypothetical protein
VHGGKVRLCWREGARWLTRFLTHNNIKARPCTCSVSVESAHTYTRASVNTANCSGLISPCARQRLQSLFCSSFVNAPNQSVCYSVAKLLVVVHSSTWAVLKCTGCSLLHTMSLLRDLWINAKIRALEAAYWKWCIQSVRTWEVAKTQHEQQHQTQHSSLQYYVLGRAVSWHHVFLLKVTSASFIKAASTSVVYDKNLCLIERTDTQSKYKSHVGAKSRGLHRCDAEEDRPNRSV